MDLLDKNIRYLRSIGHPISYKNIIDRTKALRITNAVIQEEILTHFRKI